MTCERQRGLGLSLWLIGMPGVIAVTFAVLPQLLAGRRSVLPLGWVEAISLAQSALLLALAVWVGLRCHGRAGLHAPVIEALCGRQDAWPAASRQWLPALAGGVLGALLLMSLVHIEPAAMRVLQQTTPLPLSARLLYGGLTEELLVRWGLMTALLWAWRRLVPATPVSNIVGAVLAVAASALLFGAGHLPAAAALLGPLSGGVILTIVLGNAAFGLIAGFAYWRYGLECAMGMHLLAHAIAAVAGH